jgi:hypothetical protein
VSISSFSFVQTELTSYFQRLVRLFEPAMAGAKEAVANKKAAAEKIKHTKS